MKDSKVIIISGILSIIILTILISLYFLFIPKIKIDPVINLNLLEEYNPDLLATSFNKDITSLVSYKKDIDTSKVGTYENKFEVKLGFFDVVKYQKINIIDNIKPEITLVGDKEVNICNIDSYTELGYSAYDNYDGDITNDVKVTKNNKFIYYEVKDSSGNEASTGRIINIIDKEEPKITLNGDANLRIPLNTNYIEYGATAIDNCDGTITDKIIIEGNVDETTTGNYKIKYTVKDNNNNETSIYRYVTVYDPKDNAGIIYLTFDDGPGAYTKDILDILDKYNIKATFFVTNGGNDDLLKEEYQRGHTIGLHTATHSWNIYNSVNDYFNDLNIVKERVERITGYSSKYIRFPGGSSNTVSKSHNKGIMSTLTNEVQNRGYKYYDWNVSVEDAGACAKKGVKDRSSCVLNYFKKGLSRNRINMVLLHDIKSYTANSLDSMVKYALNEGYTFKQIDDSSPMIHQRVNN